MNINIREYMAADAKSASEIWNQVVDDGVAFPQEEDLTPESGDAFSKSRHIPVSPRTQRMVRW